ncbi:MAG: hypothetical protein DYG94_10440 [Leptolyngbya sp. PLA3]|nr:MAG: hypothetical protein EDM82_09855 [Cyanobacteria bacterium CYA]MCE7969149.1 hypothetical protein [Leptolyngbya sp. PL-A3]
MDAKPWQIGVITVGLLGGLGLVGWQLFGGDHVGTLDEVMLMDVSTGDRYVADVSGRKSVFIPEKNPETGEYTLLPIHRGEDGKWRINHLELIKQFPPGQIQAIEDADSGIVKPSGSKPKRFHR